MDLESFPGRYERKDAMVFTIGKGGLFCYSTGSRHVLTWLFIFPGGQPFHGNPKAQLARQRNWEDPLIGKIIAEAEPSHVYGIKSLPKLPMWGANRIVLVGDSAHAMSPITGQGASQSLEDAQTLALLLSNMMRKFHADEVNSNSWSTTIERTLSLYYDMRHRRVEEIAAVGRALDKRMLKTQPLAEYIRYALFRAVNSFPYISE
jgi:2-polyprenyl-6-methoxyphenol hydroxylase-like FAD-dependent oxidoreductase